MIDQQDNTLLSFDHAPTTGWQTGETSESLHLITLPPDLPAGSYDLKVVLYDAKSLTPAVQVGKWQPDLTLARLVVQRGNQ